MADQQFVQEGSGEPMPEMEEQPRDQQFVDPQEVDQQEEMQEGEPGEYTGSMATALADQRISRKKASEDVKILANRIALLRAEEQKAWKKIEETKKKAQDILEVRQRNQYSNNSKAFAQQEKHMKLAELTAQNTALKHQMNDNIMRNTQSVMKQAQDEANRLKHEREQHEKMIRLQQDTDAMHNMQMKTMIRTQKADSVAQRQYEKAMKQQSQRHALIEKINAENAKRQDIERQVAQLEAAEAEWISKLQHTNQVQGAACSEYEVALTNDIEQLQKMHQERSQKTGKR